MDSNHASTGHRIAAHLSAWALIFLVGTAMPVAAFADQMTGNINLFLGMKFLNEDDWYPVEEQGEVALEFDFRQPAWPLNFVVGLRKSQGEGTGSDPLSGSLNIEGETSELSLGIRKIFDQTSVRPYLGGGLAFIDAKYEAPDFSISDSDNGIGLWVGGGVYVTLADHLNLGVDLRFSGAEVTLYDVDGAAGGAHLGVLLGYHF